MFKKYAYICLFVVGTVCGNFNPLTSEQENTFIQNGINKIIDNRDYMVKEFSALSTDSQQLIMELFSNNLNPRKFKSVQAASNYESNYMKLIENNNEAQNFLRTIFEHIQSCFDQYLNHIQKMFTNLSKDSVLANEEKDALFMKLNQSTGELIQKAVAYYYNEFYQHTNQISPDNLLSVIGEDGSVIPSEKRTKKILSLEEINNLIENEDTQISE